MRPANFITSTHLDQLRSERRSNAPGELSEGISPDAPLVIKAKDGSEFHFNSLGSTATEDGKSLNLVLHYHVDSIGRSRGRAVPATPLLLRRCLRRTLSYAKGFSGVSIFAEAQGQTAFVTEQSLAEIH